MSLPTTARGLLFALLFACSQRVEVLSSRAKSDPTDAAAPGSVAGGSLDGGSDRGSPVPVPLLLYRFDEGAGARVLDSSTEGRQVHLEIEDPANVTWLAGALRIDAATRIVTEQVPYGETGTAPDRAAATIEVWLKPTVLAVTGAHPIVDVGVDTKDRDLVLEQGAGDSTVASSAFQVRVRTERGDGFAINSGPDVAEARLMHVIAVSRGDQTACLYVDARQVICGDKTGGFDNWDHRVFLSLGNAGEQPVDLARAWLGELHMLALYAEPLNEDQIDALFARGPL